MPQPFAAESIARVIAIAETYANESLPQAVRDRLAEEVTFHEHTLRLAFELRRESDRPQGIADSNAYFSEKLLGMCEFATMAVQPDQREGYGPEKIVENVKHYAGLVRRLVNP